MKKIYLIIGLCSIGSTFAQQIDSLLCISYKNLPNTATSSTNAINSISKIAPLTGFVSNIGVGVNNGGTPISLTGGSVNQTNNTFNMVGRNSYTTIDINTGSLLQQGAINSFSSEGVTFFDNVRFNNSNTTLYGLARVQVNNQLQGLYLSKLNTESGNLTQISQNTLGTQYTVNGTVIDPDQMIYYYTSGQKFVGLDLYNGNVFTDPNYVFDDPEYFGFANIAFNCSDSEIYGLIRGQTPGVNPLFPTNFIYFLKLGKIDPVTGIVTEISDVILPSQAYSLNASATIDEGNRIYYFIGLNNILYGVSLDTGLVVSTATITFEDGEVVNFMNNFNNCIGRTALRPNPDLLNNESILKEDIISIFPNPVVSILHIKTDMVVDKVEIIDSNGRIVEVVLNLKVINVENLDFGLYFVKIYSDHKIVNQKFIKQAY
jgi:hypothetical protein